MNLDDLFDADEYLYFLASALDDEDTLEQVAFTEKVLGMQPPTRVLDVGCGHGRHSNEMARRGYRVTGVDLVDGFLEVARRDARISSASDARVSRASDARVSSARDAEASSAPPFEPTFLRADIAELAFEAAFDRAYCIYDVLGYFDDAHAQRVLAGVHRALVPSGRLLLDLRNRDWISRLPPEASHELPNGDRMIDRYRFDGERLFDQRTYIRGGVTREIEFSVRVWSLLEIRALIEGAGFVISAAFGGFDGAPVTADRHRIVCVCERR